MALDRVTFDVEAGQTLGIIGENGSGKSTLLKILARTLTPTSGKVDVKGMVSALLELGSGFHPELSGLENIYFYASLLGIARATIKKKVNDIIAFSEIGDFINYPLKTYSTGMFVRLAFSVATLIDPDILIIDEALSVGDQYFQKKCLDKMIDFKDTGKTILFCSHDMYQIKIFCTRTIWLHHGKMMMIGQTQDVVNAYVDFEMTRIGSTKPDTPESIYTKKESNFLFIRDLRFNQLNERELDIEFTVESNIPYHGHVGWAILRKDRLQISFSLSSQHNQGPYLFNEQKRLVKITIGDLNLVEANYILCVGILDREAYIPLVIETQEVPLKTNIHVVNSLCLINSSFNVI
ncbi:MAG: ABC transporter ATP-binding protein [Nitrospirae bacterium]|nr:ABC transporter ATP-binding protein [Nitrospirota bacterium]MBF0591294.1 ABC transporter ATP-binding protein [Nitrospirota bacterium]